MPRIAAELAIQGCPRPSYRENRLKYLSPQRRTWLAELHELETGEEERRRFQMHLYRMYEARARRAKVWCEEMAYE
jgi:hypothetical protein